MIGHEEEQGAERAVEQGWHGQGGEERVWGTKNNFDALQHGRVEPAGGGLVAGGEGLGASSRVATEWPTATGGMDLARGPDSTYLVVDQGRTGPSGGRLALRGPRQHVVGHWTLSAFGAERALNLPHRGLRHLEESLELAQAVGVDKNQAHALIEHIWSKAPGDIAQEVGGSGLTLLALAEAAGLDADAAEVAEVERVLAKPLEHFRRRNEEKDAAGFGPSFPACAPSAADLDTMAEEERLRRATEAGEPDELKPLVDEMMQSTDAVKWATVFVKHVLRDSSIATDEGTMLGWFANAIMAGADKLGFTAWKRSASALLCEMYRSSTIGEYWREKIAEQIDEPYVALEGEKAVQVSIHFLALVADERTRQIKEKGWTTDHDDRYLYGELVEGAVTHALASQTAPWGDVPKQEVYSNWPWDSKTLHISPDPRRCIVKAAALLSAEWERLVRAKFDPTDRPQDFRPMPTEEEYVRLAARHYRENRNDEDFQRQAKDASEAAALL